MSASNQCTPDRCPSPQPLVLLVERSADVRGRLRALLSRIDCYVAEACDPREALRIIAETDVDVVVTDLEQTPDGGLELIWGLRGLSVNRQRPEVIGWSTHASVRAIASRPEMQEVAVALHRTDDESLLLIAVQSVLDDPLAFIATSDD